MKRGLVVLDRTEIPDAERAERLDAVRRGAVAEGVSLVLVYGDVNRADDIGYLTNLTIYWNEGILAVPVDGDPVLLTKLSPRVHPWMRRTSVLTDLRSGPSFRALAAGLVDGREPGVIGLVEASLWPAPLVEDIAAAAAGWEVRSLGGLVRDARLEPSESELGLLRTAGARLGGALDAATPVGLGDGERLARLEHDLRGDGFTDVVADLAGDGHGLGSIEVTGQYRTLWVRAARLLAGPGLLPPWSTTLDAALVAAIGAVTPGAPASAPRAAATAVLARTPPGSAVHVSCVHHTDLATLGDFAAQEDEISGGAVLTVGIEVLLEGGGRVAVAETVLVGADGAERLTGKEASA